MSMLAFAIIAAVVLISAFVQGSTGMGFAMILAPVVTFIDPSLIPVMLLVLMIPLNLYIAAREREHIDWTGVKWISVGRFAGTFAGLWILVIVSLHQLALLIRLVDAHRRGRRAAGAEVHAEQAGARNGRARHRSHGDLDGHRRSALRAGISAQSGPGLRSTVAVCFLVGEIISLIVLAFSGQVSTETLMTTAWMLPFLAVGSFLSRYVHHRLDGPVLRYIVLGFAIVSGIIVIVQA